MKIYLANALFSESDHMYNALVCSELENLGFEVYAPQNNTSINDKTKSADSVKIYLGDKAELDSSDILVALLDGLAVDPGVAAEIGYMAAKGKTIIGLFTDSRENSKTSNESKIKALKKPLETQFPYVNLFVVGAIKQNGKVFPSRELMYKHLKKLIKQ
jgi:nucleoside 2-deoxyribosyltransferase